MKIKLFQIVYIILKKIHPFINKFSKGFFQYGLHLPFDTKPGTLGIRCAFHHFSALIFCFQDKTTFGHLSHCYRRSLVMWPPGRVGCFSFRISLKVSFKSNRTRTTLIWSYFFYYRMSQLVLPAAHALGVLIKFKHVAVIESSSPVIYCKLSQLCYDKKKKKKYYTFISQCILIEFFNLIGQKGPITFLFLQDGHRDLDGGCSI